MIAMQTAIPPTVGRAPRRSGMLLLIVLLMLSLFLGIGAILLTLAARARASARASAALNASSTFGDALARDALDQALMAVLRGATSDTTGSVTLSGTMPVMECLLADKYGPSTTGSCTAVTNANTALMQLNIEALTPAVGSNSAELNGRILTVRPLAGQGDTASFRILGSRIVGTSGIAYVARLPGTTQPVLPTAPFAVVINGRDFMPVGGTAEGHDAYDSDNFLARPVITGGVFSGTFSKFSYFSAPAPPPFPPPPPFPVPLPPDNDNDGVNDGVWISGTLPPPYSSGTTYISGTIIPSIPSPLGTGTVSFDVSYLIVDLDGRLNINAAGTGASLTSGSFPGAPASIAPGMGYGPADVNPSFVLPPTPPPAALPLVSSSLATSLIVGGTPATSLTTGTSWQKRMPPRIGLVDGRYGRTSAATAGRTGDDTEAAQRTTSTAFATDFAGNSRADVRSRMKVFMTAPAAAPILNFELPNGDTSADSLDDPYEARLDTRGQAFSTARRPAPTAGQSDDNLFSLSELEPVLRPNDVDAPQLPPRLAALLGDFAQRYRTYITTDSWDTPALTGSAAVLITRNLLSGTVTGTNSIRPLAYPWSPLNAASPDIAAGLRFNINRPVASGTANDAAQQAYCRGLYTLIAALQPGFPRDRAAQWAVNVLDFRDTDSRMTRFRYATDLTAGWPATLPAEVWGMERPDLIIRSVTPNDGTPITSIALMNPYRAIVVGSGTTEMVDTSLIATGSANTVDLKRTVGTGDTIWRLRTSGTVVDGKNLSASPFQPQVSGTVTLSPPLALGTPPTVILERLADPSQPFNATTNPYRPVDRITIPFMPPASLSWIHWPNRPFISQAEALLVSSGTIPTAPTPSLMLSIPELLEATHTPTLFAGHAVTGSANQLNVIGLDQIPSNNLSLWREPGRININTIISGTTSAPVDNVLWMALVGTGTFGTNPVTSSTSPVPTPPITSLGQLLAPPSPLATMTFGDLRDRNPYFSRALAIRLANTVTLRSHVFAIWITVRVTDSSPGAPAPVTKRLFAIVDRSIPVGYLPGRDLNVRDMIRLRTFID